MERYGASVGPVTVDELISVNCRTTKASMPTPGVKAIF
jgi:hypothetical protein